MNWWLNSDGLSRPPRVLRKNAAEDGCGQWRSRRRAYSRSALVTVGCSGTSRCFVLPGPHVHRAVGEIDVGAVKPERFAEPQPGEAISPITVLNAAARIGGVNAPAARISAAISAGE